MAITRNWIKCDSPEHIKLYNDVVNVFREAGYFEGVETPPLYWIKSVRSFGQCSYKVKLNENPNYYNNSKTAVISDAIGIHIGYKKLEPKKALETIVHEVTHAAASARYGRNGVGHGYYFKTIGNKMGKKFFVQVQRLASQKETDDLSDIFAQTNGKKHYDVLYSIKIYTDVGLRFKRKWLNKTINPKYVDTFRPYRNEIYFTQEVARDAAYNNYKK